MEQGKGLDPHKMPEKQPQPVVKLTIEKKPRLGQGRAGIKRKINLALPLLKKEVSIGPDVIKPKPISGSSEAILAVDTVVPISLPKVPKK